MDFKRKIDSTPVLLILLFVTTAFLLLQFARLLNESQRHSAEEVELLSLSHDVLHANDYLIKVIKIYVLSLDETYRTEYFNMLNDYDSFYGRLDRMMEIGLSESETEKISRMEEIWSRLEELENAIFDAIDSGDNETAVSIIYSEEYTDTDNQLAELIQSLNKEIGERGRIKAQELNRQLQIVMFVFSAAFLSILTVLAVTIIKNNKLKNLYEQSSRYKSSFLATVSHEIRTPMNAILGISEIQLKNDTLSAELEDAFGKIYESGSLLLHIINDVLDMSKIEAGKLEIVPAEYDVPSIINDIVQINRLNYNSKPIVFHLEIGDKLPLSLFGDEFRIRQVMNNILSNAFKYTDEGKITLSVSAEYDQENDRKVTLVFRVTDTGKGMTEDQIKLLFDEFSRINLDANRTTMGIGLGMNIARRLVHLMEGEISVDSKPGEGTVFTVRLPQKRIGDGVCDSELIAKLQSFSFHSISLTRKIQIIREYMPYGSVLVVDDVESNLFVARGMLIPYGLKVDTVPSGYEAIDKIKNGNEYDIIFMDHMMPGMDGIETTKRLREMGYKKYIVALTANAIIGQAGVFLKNGFDGYISKPIDSREMNFLLNDLIRDKKPKEVVEAARREQVTRDTSKNAFASEVKKYFVMDAEKAIKLLTGINTKVRGKYPLTDEDWQSYIISVHGIKSALANIGEEDLSKTALALETAGHDRDTGIFGEKLSGFINALQSLIFKYQPEEKEFINEISGEIFSLLKDKMLEIKHACEAFDKKTAKDALKALNQKVWPRQISRFLDDISVFLLYSDFEEAAVLAESIIEQFEV